MHSWELEEWRGSLVFRSGTNIAGQHLIKEVAGGGRLILTKMGKRGNWQDPENMQVGPTRRKNSRAQVGLCQERERKRKKPKKSPTWSPHGSFKSLACPSAPSSLTKYRSSSAMNSTGRLETLFGTSKPSVSEFCWQKTLLCNSAVKITEEQRYMHNWMQETLRYLGYPWNLNF